MLDWMAGPHVEGWLALPHVATATHHGTGRTFASGVAAALALGFVSTDAAVLAKMATTSALRHAYACAGAGPVHACPGFAADPSLLPWLSLARCLPSQLPERNRSAASTSMPLPPAPNACSKC